MRQLDRYSFVQLLGPFAVFVLIFAGILWLNQALKIIDLVVENGQGGAVFFELSVLLVPRILELAVPIGTFAAAVFLTNRMMGDSEMPVMMAAGLGPFGIARPFFVFGLMGALVMSLLMHWAIPKTYAMLEDRKFDIQREFLAQVISEGAFISPVEGLTFFFGSTEANGDLADVLISEQDEAGGEIIHSAQRGQIISEGGDNKLLLLNGSIQQYAPKTRTLNVVQFDSLSYDLNQFAGPDTKRKTDFREMSTFELLRPNQDRQGERYAQGHRRIVTPLLTIVTPVLGYIILLFGGFQRTGVLLRILVAVGFTLTLNALTGVTESMVADQASIWPILYAPPMLGAILGLTLLLLSSQRIKPFYFRKALS